MAGVKAAVAWPNGKVFVFDKETPAPFPGLPAIPGITYERFDFVSGARDQSALLIATYWPGLLPARPDAALYWGFGKVYFFYGATYVRFDIDTNSVEPAWVPPLPIAGHWTMPWTDRIDAAVNWGNGKVYFFRDGQYLRYDIATDRTDPNYPKAISGRWPGLWTDRIDAALYQGGATAYFFRDDEFRRFNLSANTVDQTGNVSTLALDPVPRGMCTPARDLTLEDANQVMGYLIQSGKFDLSATQTPYVGDWRVAVASPQPSTRVVITPSEIDGVTFTNDGAPTATVIDNVDQRMVVALYRLTRWLNASDHDVEVIRHKGIGHGIGAATDCHNQGRALDFSGVEGHTQGVAFNRSVWTDWGQRAVVPGNPMRLDATADRLGHDIFRAVLMFGKFECESNGIGSANHWPPKDIGDVGGYVAHPDYVDEPPPANPLRAAHQNHVHMQIGPT